ncbi:tetratricopeptide repeat-containing sensor histidine kinase [Flagellimonas marinaquae]|uniref:tetratricopeptide repeat-containing sensor histidine kinase n=1 Tax=Flagellimonas marinaquae TaxID=254955 RepID=UPI0020758BDD|nr:sensor histidine kinase [Allomuricauda aquimarina]USD23726.1 sensor histidine kinase [Allomuricauda aquimarina]
MPFFAQDIQQQISALKDSLKLKKGEDRILVLKDIGMKFRSINYDSAWYYTKIGYSEAIEQQNEYLAARLTISFGILENGNGNSLEALKYYKRALPTIINSDDHFAKGALYTNMSNAYEKIGEVDHSVSYQLKALQEFEISKDSIWIAGSYNNLGSRYQAIEEYDTSENYFKKARDLYGQLGYEYYVALINNNLASIYLLRKDYVKAMVYADKSLEGFVSSGAYFETVTSLYNLGYAHQGSKEFDLALDYFEKALKIQQEKEDWYVAIHLKNDIAKTYILQGKLNKAKAIADQAYDEALQKGIVLAQLELCNTLSEINNNLGNYGEAYTFLQQSVKINDSLKSDERAKEVLNLKEKYESEQKENEILRQQNQLVESELSIKKRNNMLMGSGGLVAILLIVGFVLFREQKIKAKNFERETVLEKAMAEARAQENLKEQRLRIARDLHDNIGSQLTYLTSLTDSAKRGIDKGEVFLMEKLTQMKQFSLVTISELRDTIWAMNKDEISLEDIKERTQQLAATVHEATDDKTRVKVKGTPANSVLNAFVGMNLFRIIQESVNNAVKHSGSELIEVIINEIDGAVQIVVLDFGRGFDTSKESTGNGLHIMRNRAEKAGVDFEQESKLGKGTKVTLRVRV